MVLNSDGQFLDTIASLCWVVGGVFWMSGTLWDGYGNLGALWMYVWERVSKGGCSQKDGMGVRGFISCG